MKPFRVIRLRQAGPAGDPSFSNVGTLLHMDGSNGGTTFTDVKGLTYTAMGSANTSNAQAKFGATSLAGASSAYITTPTSATLYLGSASFTLEMWTWLPTSLTGNAGLVFYESGGGVELFVNSSNNVQLNFRNSGAAVTGVTAFPRDQWAHLAIVRNGTNIAIYINGVSDASATTSGVFNNGALQVGACVNAGYYLPGGYIDDFRITPGIARYLSNFSPPTAAFPDF